MGCEHYRVKRIVLTALFLLICPAALSATQSVVQCTEAFFDGSSTTEIGNFASSTTAGNTLLLAASSSWVESSPPSAAPTISTPTAPGFIWQLVVTGPNATPQPDFADYYTTRVSLYYIPNAASMSNAVDTTVVSSNVVGFQLCELTGVGAVDTTANSSGTSNPATAGNLATTQTDIVWVLTTDPNFNSEFVAGSGYTQLAPGGEGSFYAANQYMLNVAPGDISTAWGSGISGGWSILAAAFKPASVSSVPRHHGLIF